jgi:hypothetical protein
VLRLHRDAANETDLSRIAVMGKGMFAVVLGSLTLAAATPLADADLLQSVAEPAGAGSAVLAPLPAFLPPTPESSAGRVQVWSI